MKREKGYYWVKRADQWIIAFYYQSGEWYFIGMRTSLIEDDLEEIDENKIVRK